MILRNQTNKNKVVDEITDDFVFTESKQENHLHIPNPFSQTNYLKIITLQVLNIKSYPVLYHSHKDNNERAQGNY